MGLWWMVGEEDGGRGGVGCKSNVIDVAEERNSGGGLMEGCALVT